MFTDKFLCDSINFHPVTQLFPGTLRNVQIYEQTPCLRELRSMCTTYFRIDIQKPNVTKFQTLRLVVSSGTITAPFRRLKYRHHSVLYEISSQHPAQLIVVIRCEPLSLQPAEASPSPKYVGITPSSGWSGLNKVRIKLRDLRESSEAVRSIQISRDESPSPDAPA